MSWRRFKGIPRTVANTYMCSVNVGIIISAMRKSLVQVSCLSCALLDQYCDALA
jgi:hypothetical protein